MPKAKPSNSLNSGTESSPSETHQKIINYIRAGYPGLYLVSAEEQRVQVEMKAISNQLKYHLYFWSSIDGLVEAESGKNQACNDPLEALIAMEGLKEQTIILLQDFHLFLADPNPILIRKLKDASQLPPEMLRKGILRRPAQSS